MGRFFNIFLILTLFCSTALAYDPQAEQIKVDTTTLDGTLTGLSPNDVQQALEVIDDLTITGTDDQVASEVPNTPSGNLVATDVQGALNELQTEIDGLAGGGADNLGDHTATQNLDMATFAITNVGNVDGRDVSADGIKLDGIEAGAKDDQSASEVANTPSGNLVATDVQGALNEIQTEIDGLQTNSHVAVTVSDTATIDLTLAGQALSAVLIGNLDADDLSDNTVSDLSDVSGKSGNTNTLATTTGVVASVGCAQFDVNGNLTNVGSSCGVSGGEANTASNVGTAGVGVFKQKTGVDLEFKKVNAGSSKISITDDVANNEVDVDVVEANLTLSNIGGSVTDGQIPATIARDSELHSAVTVSDSSTIDLTLAGQDVSGIVIADSINGSELSDAIILDATTTIDMDTNTSDLNFDSNTLFIDQSTNRIGIGTSTPTVALDIVGDINASGDISGANVSFTDSMKIPTSTAPVTDAVGKIALDTLITDHQPLLQYYDGGENMTVIAIDTAELPALDGEIIKYNATTDKFYLGSESGGGSGAFSDASDPVVLNTTTKDVAIGTTAINTSKVSIDGDADQVQFTVQGNATQTDSVIIVETSDGTETLNIEADGTILTAVGIDVIGAVDMDYGSADVTDHTFTTDGTGDSEIVLPNNSIGSAEMIDASETTSGDIEIATIAEVDAGTDATRAVTPDALQGSDRNIRYVVVPLIASDTDVATATTIAGDWVIPFSGTIIQDDTQKYRFSAYNSTAGTTGTMTVDVNLNGTTIMTTNKISIETTEKNSADATTQPDLTTTTITAGDILTFDIDAVHTTPAKGLTVIIPIRED